MSTGAAATVERGCEIGALDTARTTIAAPAANVYGLLLDRSRWFEGFVGKTHVDGPFDSVGERAIFRTANGERLEEVLVADPPRRLVARLADVADRETHAFAEWRIECVGDACVVEFNLYWIDSVPRDSSWTQAQATRAEWREHTRRALEGHAARIKQAAEARQEKS